MTKSHDDKSAEQSAIKEDIILGKDDVEALSARQRAWVAGATVGAQVLANSTQRQVFANLRLGINTGENPQSLVGRFSKNPSTLFSGLSHRFTLQALTQGLPMYYNRANADASARPKISDSLTALWMTTAGCFFEVSGLKQPIEDKAKASGKEEVNFWSKAPRVGAVITPLVLVRNNIYAKVVFGQNKDDPLSQRVAIAAIAGVATNPIDAAVNIVAYETAVAKDGTPLTEIYRNTWRNFIAAESAGHPYERFVKVARNALSGAPLRVLGVSGACAIFSKQAGDTLEEAFSDYSRSITNLWDSFQNNVAEKGGIENDSQQKPPSTNVCVKKSQQLGTGRGRDDESR